MDIERLKKIIRYSETNRNEMTKNIKNFYSISKMDYESDIRNVLQIVRTSFFRKHYLVLELPIADNEIGALCYKGDGLGYVIINSSLSKLNVNFSLAHEVYHVFYGENTFPTRIEFSDSYQESEEEFAANLFAGMILMPESSFSSIFRKFYEETNQELLPTFVHLMSYYQVPFMAVLIRCHELNLLPEKIDTYKLIQTTKEEIREIMLDLWLDENLLLPTQHDDYSFMKEKVESLGNRYIEENLLNDRALNIVLSNMERLYKEIKGV